ncbi:MAG: Chitin synthase, class 3 [Alyxoria varia]|nr:MAG: Chitin synthase, class 3 [Alyxoria varia]
MDRRDRPRRPQPAPTSPERNNRTAHRRRRDSDVEGRNTYSPVGSRSPPKRSAREHVSEAPPSPSRKPHDRNANTHPTPQDVNRSNSGKRSLVRPERRRMDSQDPNFYYRRRAQKMEVMPSETGNDPLLDREFEDDSVAGSDVKSHAQTELGKDDLARSTSRKLQKKATQELREADIEAKKRQKAMEAARVPTLWGAYCHLITFWCPDMVLALFGKSKKAQQRAWREKMGLISLILLICLFVGFLTFGFTAAVCPPGANTRLRINEVGKGYLIIHGRAYDLTQSKHPYARGIPDGANVLYLESEVGSLGGYDGSFMFQNVNGNCKGLITAAEGSDIPTNDNGDLGWYFPCVAFKQDGSSKVNTSEPFYLGWACHLSSNARNAYYGLESSSDVYFTWDDVKNKSRNLAVWGGDVVDLDLLRWFNNSQVSWPSRFDEIRENAEQHPELKGSDLTLPFSSSHDQKIAKCFSELIRVGSIDTDTIGCIASKVVLYVSLIFILSIVVAKFTLAVAFQWFLSRKYAPSKGVSKGKKRDQDIEDWSSDIYRPPPRFDEHGALSERSSRTSALLPTKSRFTSPYAIDAAMGKGKSQPTTMATQTSTSRLVSGSGLMAAPGSESPSHLPHQSRDSRSSLLWTEKNDHRLSSNMSDIDGPGPAGFIHENVVPQPPVEWQPFGYPLAHTINLVTCYSEGGDGLRTTLDSIATTDYPNSHKLIFVVCDGMIKGHGEEFTTPEIVLGMMKEHTILPDEVQPFSYVAVASGSKRHNMAKVYSGFYDYGDNTQIPADKRQRVPMVTVVKCGTPDEETAAKPGNRGKRDSQIILMSFLQKVMFDERMTELEYEMFNGIWKITGISADFYEIVLMVDADTKVYHDSMTHMCSAMVKDPQVMGLCGETKIANKRDTWVTMIQVFELVLQFALFKLADARRGTNLADRYFISHHQAKSFESVFGGVTCLPGCFCMYRIKAPKGGQNYWVPILANPDIVEHYSENVVETLHDKNLLLLGEDRFLSTLMLKTFPKRKQIFVPHAICKTVVPDAFKVLLSQRRRWINSTIHNLFELVLVRDLCGTFCFSMQFVVFIDLVGTLVLPVAIMFTIYLIIAAIVATIQGTEVPTIPLILLALILGLPGLLIVITANNVSYVLWMMVYLISLPIWNGILPAYAYWKFDDFSWGDTRKTAGEKTKKAGLEYEGEFDSTKITMKRWGEFEQERRLKGTAGYPQMQSSSRPGSAGFGFRRSNAGLDSNRASYVDASQ